MLSRLPRLGALSIYFQMGPTVYYIRYIPFVNYKIQLVRHYNVQLFRIRAPCSSQTVIIIVELLNVIIIIRIYMLNHATPYSKKIVASFIGGYTVQNQSAFAVLQL